MRLGRFFGLVALAPFALGAARVALADPATPAAAAPPAGELAVEERQPMIMMVQAPPGADLNTRTADLLRIASEVLREHTDLRILSPEQAGSDPAALMKCERKTRLACWTRAVRREYDRQAMEMPNGEVRPFAEYLAGLKDQAVPRFLLVLSSQPSEDGREQLSALLLSADRALQVYHDAPRSQPDWAQRVENQIFEKAVVSQAGFAVVSDPRSIRDYFKELIDQRFRKAFEESGHWETFGSISLKTEVSNLAIELDGKSIGATKGGPVSLVHLQPGKRILALSDPEGRYVKSSQEVVVTRGGVASVIPLLVESPEHRTGWPRTALFWGGLGVAATGAVITTYALATRPKVFYIEACPPGVCSEASKSQFAGFCELGSTDPACLTSKKGVLAAPLGYSLAATGAIWALSAWLFGDQPLSIAWIPLAAGLAVGAASYGISAAATSK